MKLQKRLEFCLLIGVGFIGPEGVVEYFGNWPCNGSSIRRYFNGFKDRKGMLERTQKPHHTEY